MLVAEGVGLAGKRTLQLSANLCAAAELRFGTAFASLEQLLEIMLTELLRDEPAKMDEADEQLVEQRLWELGYL
jgi:hypothetical protein